MSKKRIGVLGAGLSGLVAAAHLAEAGHSVQIIDMHDTPGGRCRAFSAEGFLFDIGPSWYWMPELFEDFFQHFGHKVSDFYDLKRLDPSYQVFFKDDAIELPADMNALKALMDQLEPGAGQVFQKFMDEAKIKYDIGMGRVVYKPSLSPLEYIDWEIIKGSVHLNLLSSFKNYVHKKFKSPKIRQLLEFPVLFLGAKPSEIPALYSMMNFADSSLGTWYPMGGMHKIAEGFAKVAEEAGASFLFNTKVEGLRVQQNRIDTVLTNDGPLTGFDVVLSTMDYQHTESLLEKGKQSYSDKYWDSRRLSPSCLLFYLGVDEKINGLQHHNLFFDADFDGHAYEIYDDPKWPTEPLFYVCCPSKTDPAVAPEGKENLFILIPVAPDLQDSENLHNYYYDMVMSRMEARFGMSIKDKVIYRRDFGVSDFKKEYNSYKGNAYGLANTLLQTAFLKPKMKSKKVKNLYYAGQLTVPGPGLPPSIVSGEVAAKLINQS